MLRILLRNTTDVFFVLMVFVAVVFISRELLGILTLSQRLGVFVTGVFSIGTPVFLLLALCSFFVLGQPRHKIYVLFAGLMLVFLCGIFYVIYASKI